MYNKHICFIQNNLTFDRLYEFVRSHLYIFVRSVIAPVTLVFFCTTHNVRMRMSHLVKYLRIPVKLGWFDVNVKTQFCFHVFRLFGYTCFVDKPQLLMRHFSCQ